MALIVGVSALMGVNGLAYMQARAFTHYDPTQDKKERLDDLSWKAKARILVTGASVPRPENSRKPPFWYTYSVHKFPSTAGVRLEAWYLPRDKSPALVVMFHGYGEAKASILDEAKAFRSLGYSTLMVDFRGSGGSSGAVTTLGYREADDVAASVEYAKKLEPGKPIVIYGSSMGSVAALRAMALKGVKPAAAILECPFDSMLGAIKSRFAILRAPSFPAAQLLVFWGGAQFGFNGFGHNTCDYAARIDVPVLLINGDEDRRVTVNQIRSVYSCLKGPKQLEVFKGSGHGGYVDDSPKRWRQAVTDFIASYSN